MEKIEKMRLLNHVSGVMFRVSAMLVWVCTVANVVKRSVFMLVNVAATSISALISPRF